MKQLISLGFVSMFLAACQCGAPGVSCRTTADCTGGKLCATSLQTCVECVDDTSCALGSICNASGSCEPGCRGEHDRCALGQFCTPGVDHCVSCLMDSNCGVGRLCRNEQCVDGCSTASPGCAPGLVCNTTTNTCVQCVTGSNCVPPQPPMCSPTTQTCVECVMSSDCHDPNKPVCDPASSVCVQCLQNSQCSAGNVCTNQRCVPGCTPTQPCPTGQVCNPTNSQCVQCVNDTNCTGATPKCNTQTNRCVQCLPGPADMCPVGEYCRADFICERGCKTNSDCPSGQCLADHSCGACTGDAQCAAGKICSNGTCVNACSAANACGSGRDCCGGHCFDLQNDAANCGTCGHACGSQQTCCAGSCVALNTTAHCGACGTMCGTGEGCCSGSCTNVTTLTNCGACGTACGVDQFCDGTTCRNQTFPEFCANRQVYAISDGIAADDAATSTLASTIQQYCSSQTVIHTGPQTNAQWVDQTTGALLLGGGSTVVTAGGPFPNKPVKWLEKTRMATKVFFATNGTNTYYFRRRSDNVDVVTKPTSFCTPANDVFVVELVTDPSSGTLALISYGACSGGNGTRTGAWYWANQMLPNRMSYPNSWYIYEWADTNGNMLPDASDTFTQLATGM